MPNIKIDCDFRGIQTHHTQFPFYVYDNIYKVHHSSRRGSLVLYFSYYVFLKGDCQIPVMTPNEQKLLLRTKYTIIEALPDLSGVGLFSSTFPPQPYQGLVLSNFILHHVFPH